MDCANSKMRQILNCWTNPIQKYQKLLVSRLIFNSCYSIQDILTQSNKIIPNAISHQIGSSATMQRKSPYAMDFDVPWGNALHWVCYAMVIQVSFSIN